MPHFPSSWWQRLFARRVSSSSDRPAAFTRAAGWSTRPRSQRPDFGEHEWTFAGGAVTDRAFATRLHRFMRDHIPVLKAVIWTWTRLAAAPSRFEISASTEAIKNRSYAVLSDLSHRIHPDRLTRFAGFDALLLQYFDALFTDGAVCGELTLLPSRAGLARFDFIDTATLEFAPDPQDGWRMYQRTPGGRLTLDSDAIFYQPLDAEAGRPHGKSLIGAVGFVARIEQELVRDIGKATHNAGYHRLHVAIKPPAPGAAESDSDYTARANAYFDQTVRALREFDVDDNPVTWDDVEIRHISPSGEVTSSRSWYLNHRSMVEDVIAGCHLASFMLGYAYGGTQTWAKFKYEMVGRQIATLQRAASRFCEWIANIELALHGLDAEARHVFDNRLDFDRRERYETDRALTDLILRQLESGLITIDEARQKLA
ncbi:MAG TPA: hypothetical protein VNN55_07440 [bacterium]|nr:hypothetical protein [bacterium]